MSRRGDRSPAGPWTALLLAAVLASSACGYRFAGGGTLPSGVRRLSIPMVENETGQVGIEAVFSNDLVYEFSRNSNVVLDTDPEAVDAVLRGRILSARTETISHRGRQVALERRVEVELFLQLVTPDGEILWAAPRLSGHEAYGVSEEKLQTESNRRRAIARISKRMAEDAFNRLTADF